MSAILGILITIAPTFFLAIRYRTEWKAGISGVRDTWYYMAVLGMVALGIYVVCYGITDGFPYFHARRRPIILYLYLPICFALATFPKVAADYMDAYASIAEHKMYGYVGFIGWLGVAAICLGIATR